MKNDKCIIVALLGFVVIGMQIKKQDVKLASASTYPYGVGFCIDITKDSYSGNNFIVGAPIYKDTFFNSSPYNFVSQNKSLYYEAYGESLLDYSLNYQTGYNIDFGLNTNLPGFSMDMKNGFSHNISIADSSVSNQFYYKRSYESYKYNVSLKNKAYLLCE